MASTYIELGPNGAVGSGVTSVNSLTGAVVLAAGSNITLTPAGNTITIAATASGSGDVVGPASATDNAVARFDSTTGKLIQNSVVIIDDTGAITGSPSYSGNAATATTATNFSGSLSGDVTGTQSATAISAPTVTGKLITGFVSGAGTVTAADSILSAIDKLDGNIATKQPTGNYITALTGDVTASGPGSVAATLATVNGNVGSFGSSTSIPSLTVNAKGLVTAASGNAVIAPAGTLTGATLAVNVLNSSLTALGTVTTGVWNGTTIALANGGTGQTTKAPAFDALSPMTTQYDLIIGGAAGTGTRLAKGANGTHLTTQSGVVAWTADPTPYVVSTINSNTSAVAGTTYLCDTSGAAFNVTLPTPVSGAFIVIKDKTGSFSTNNLTLLQNAAEQIEGLAASKVFQTSWGSWSIFSDGTNWFLGPF